MGGERGGGVERRLERGRSQGLNLFLSGSLPLGLVREGYQFKHCSLKGQQKEDRQPLPFSGMPAEGEWQLVVLLLTSMAVNSAFSSSSWSPGSFDSLFSIRKG